MGELVDFGGGHGMTTTTKQFSKRALATMIADIEAWIDQANDEWAEADAEDNEAKAGTLQERIDALENARDALEELE